MKNFHTILILLLLTLQSYSQDCTDFHQYHCTYGDYTYFYSRQSKSFLATKGQTTEIQMIAYEGETYYMAVCANKKFGALRFRILEDDRDKTVLYDNADNDYKESIIFSNEVTKNLILEVYVPEGSPDEAKEFRCVGLVIQFKKT